MPAERGRDDERERVTGPLHKNNPILIGTWPKILQISNLVICNLGEVVQLAATFSAGSQKRTQMYFDEVIRGSWRN